MRPSSTHHRPNTLPATRLATVLAVAIALTGLTPATAAASPLSYTGFANIAAPFAARLPATEIVVHAQGQDARQAPPVQDPAGGVVVSVFGGSVFSGASTFQVGGAFAYFFGAKATVGFEVEGATTFGPGGRVIHGQGSLIIQTGARTSKWIPYIALGVGFLRATTSLPTRTSEVLESLGIDPTPTVENAPYVHFGGGVRFYLKPNVAVRGDVRFAQVALDIPDQSFTDTFPMRRIAVMLSWDF